MWFLWNPEAHLTLFFCIQYLVWELCRELCSCIHTLFCPLPLVLRDLFVDVSVSFTVLLQLSHLLQKALNLLLLMLQCPFQPLCHSTVQSLWDISLYVNENYEYAVKSCLTWIWASKRLFSASFLCSWFCKRLRVDSRTLDSSPVVLRCSCDDNHKTPS